MNASRHTSAWDSPGFLLWHATLRWQRAMRAALEPHGLTHVQFVLLASVWWLNEHGEQPTQAVLARRAGTDPMMTSQVLRALEDQGLVERLVSSTDGRARVVTVTDEGRTRVVPALRAVESADEEFFAPVAIPSTVAMLRALVDAPADASY